MMYTATYKCMECGHIFDLGEEYRWTEPHGERMSGCPNCLGGYQHTFGCDLCGSAHLSQELYAGVCEECLPELITYDLFLEYLQGDAKNGNRLPDFMFVYVFESETPALVGDKLMDTLAEWFMRCKADDILRGKTAFLDLCRAYVMTDDGDAGRSDYAAWIRRGKR